MIKELRRLGGLIKHNFGIIRDQGQQEAVMEMNRTLLAIQQMEDKWHENIAAQREHERQKDSNSNYDRNRQVMAQAASGKFAFFR